MNVGLLFGVIFASIVIGFVLFFGVTYIGDMNNVSCASQLGQQMTNLESAVRSTLSLSQGSSQELKILVPGCFQKICFVDPEDPEKNPQQGWDPDRGVLSIVESQENNVIVYMPGGTVDAYRIDRFEPYVNFCITSTENVILKNTGREVQITLPEF